MAEKIEIQSIKELGLHVSELVCRRKKPNYWLYILFIMVFLGNLGIWHELWIIAKAGSYVSNVEGLIKSLASYGPAVVGASVAQIIIGDSRPELRFPSFCAFILMAVIALVVLDAGLLGWEVRLLLGVLLSLFSLIVWTVSISDDGNLVIIPPAAALGNDPGTAPRRATSSGVAGKYSAWNKG